MGELRGKLSARGKPSEPAREADRRTDGAATALRGAAAAFGGEVADAVGGAERFVTTTTAPAVRVRWAPAHS